MSQGAPVAVNYERYSDAVVFADHRIGQPPASATKDFDRNA
jgi:hypothetical protein